MLTATESATRPSQSMERDRATEDLLKMASLHQEFNEKVQTTNAEISKAQQAMNVRNAQSLQDLSNLPSTQSTTSSSILNELSQNSALVKENQLQQNEYQSEVESIVKEKQSLRSQLTDIELLVRLLQQQMATCESASLKTKAYAVKENEVNQKRVTQEQSAVNLVVADIRRQNGILQDQINLLTVQEQKHVQVEQASEEECVNSVKKLEEIEAEATQDRDTLAQKLAELRQLIALSDEKSRLQNDQMAQLTAETDKLESVAEQLREKSLVGTVEGYNKQFEELLTLISTNNDELKQIREQSGKSEAEFFEIQAQNRGLELKLNGLKSQKQMTLAQDATQELQSLELLAMEGQHRARLLQDSCLQTIDKWQKRVKGLVEHLKANANQRVQEAQADLSKELLDKIRDRDQEIIDLNSKKLEIESKLTSQLPEADIVQLQKELSELVQTFKASTGQRIEQIKQLLDHLQHIYTSKHSSLQSVREDIFRAKNAIDLIQKDLHQKRQVSLSIATELTEQQQISEQLDQELIEQNNSHSQLQDEIVQLDDLIAKQQKVLQDKDTELENMKNNLADVQQRKKEEEEAFKLHLIEEAQKRQQRDWYVPEKDNDLDEEFAKHVNNSSYNVHVQRLKDGQYLYGTKRIYAKIMNGKLVVRLNGGFMLIEEFLQSYAEGESKLQMMQDQVWNPLQQTTGSITAVPSGAKSPGRTAKAGSPRTGLKKGAGSPRFTGQK